MPLLAKVALNVIKLISMLVSLTFSSSKTPSRQRIIKSIDWTCWQDMSMKVIQSPIPRLATLHAERNSSIMDGVGHKKGEKTNDKQVNNGCEGPKFKKRNQPW